MKILISAQGSFRLSTKLLKYLVLANQCMVKDSNGISFYYFNVDVGDGFRRSYKYNALEYNGVVYVFDGDRSNPFLIAEVEKLGEAANGKHRTLKIVEIPDDIEWYIVEDDVGTESIHEKHRIWS